MARTPKTETTVDLKWITDPNRLLDWLYRSNLSRFTVKQAGTALKPLYVFPEVSNVLGCLLALQEEGIIRGIPSSRDALGFREYELIKR